MRYYRSRRILDLAQCPCPAGLNDWRSIDWSWGDERCQRLIGPIPCAQNGTASTAPERSGVFCPYTRRLSASKIRRYPTCATKRLKSRPFAWKVDCRAEALLQENKYVERFIPSKISGKLSYRILVRFKPVPDHLSGQVQHIKINNKFGQYNLILRSRKLEARAFKRRSCHWVMPISNPKGDPFRC